MRITIDISKQTTKRILVLGAVASGLLGAAVVHAGLPFPALADGSVLTAAQLNGNFGDLNTRLAAAEATIVTLQSRPKTIGGFVTCAASGCTVPFAYPAGSVVSAVRTGVGSYTLTFPTTYNGTINACTITSENAVGVPVTIQGAGDNQLKVTLFAVGNTGPTEGNFTFTCVGAFP